MGGLRFALTCRHIDPNTLMEDERQVAAEKGAFPPGSEQYDYDGSIYATPETPATPVKSAALRVFNDIKAKFQTGELEVSDICDVLQDLTEYVSTHSGST